MSEKSKKQFGVWMDLHHATIVGRENVDSGDFVILGHEKVEGQGSNSSEMQQTMLKEIHFKNYSKTLLLTYKMLMNYM